jgi:site-specific DNA-adenine methylase
MINKSPLRYPGGKTRACKILDEYFLKNFEKDKISTIVSPFFGGGSFEFFLQNKYNFNIKSFHYIIFGVFVKVIKKRN